MKICETNITELKKESNSPLKGVIAVVSGPTFFPDKTSRNKVHYPKQAWVEALKTKAFQDRIKNRNMFGTIGHNDVIDDEFLRTGQFSHIVSNAYIDENNVGICTYDILDTPTGRIVKTLLDAGVKIKVSTQIEGDIDESAGEEDEQVIKPGTIDFFRVDFVIDPGFLETDPKIKEAYNKAFGVKEKTILQKEKVKSSTTRNTKTQKEVKQKENVFGFTDEMPRPLIKREKPLASCDKCMDFKLQIKMLEKKLQEQNDFISNVEKDFSKFKTYKKFYTQKYYKSINDLGALLGLEAKDVENLLNSSINILNMYSTLSGQDVINPININNYKEDEKLQYLEDLVQCLRNNEMAKQNKKKIKDAGINKQSYDGDDEDNSFMFERKIEKNNYNGFSESLRELLE